MTSATYWARAIDEKAGGLYRSQLHQDLQVERWRFTRPPRPVSPSCEADLGPDRRGRRQCGITPTRRPGDAGAVGERGECDTRNRDGVVQTVHPILGPGMRRTQVRRRGYRVSSVNGQEGPVRPGENYAGPPRGRRSGHRQEPGPGRRAAPGSPPMRSARAIIATEKWSWRSDESGR